MTLSDSVQLEPSSTMDKKLKLAPLCLIYLFLPLSQSIVTLRPRNERVAWNSGVDCLRSVQTLFHSIKNVLEDTEEGILQSIVQPTKKVIVLHLHNLTSPAAEIEGNYLLLLHSLISSGQLQRYIY